MSYENPQTVIDTESAKIYAQAISNMGKMTANYINADTEKKRNQALANKKRNLEDAKSRTKYNAAYLSTVDKGLKNAKGFDLKPQLRIALNDKVNEAVELKIKLDNFTGDASERMNIQNELNALETLFNSGLEEGLVNVADRRNSISELSVNGGQEDGLSYSQNDSYMIGDLASTFDGQEDKGYNVGIELVDGSYNLTMGFTGENNRNYNLNKDFANDSLVTNPNISKAVSSSMQDLQYVGKGGGLNMKGPITGILKKDTKPKIVEGVQYNFAEVDYELLYNKLENTIQATVGGIVKQGREADGDSAYGLIAMQSYVDDVLPDDLDDKIGELLPDPSTESGIDQKQFEMIAAYVVSQKTAELNTKMPPISEEETNSIDKDKKLTLGQQQSRDAIQLKYDEGKVLVDDFVENIFPNNTTAKIIDMNKIVAGIQEMGLGKISKKPDGAFEIANPENPSKPYIISINSSAYQNKLSLLNALGRNKLAIPKPEDTSDLPLF